MWARCQPRWPQRPDSMCEPSRDSSRRGPKREGLPVKRSGKNPTTGAYTYAVNMKVKEKKKALAFSSEGRFLIYGFPGDTRN
jgi:hypothetical protein